MRTRPTIVIASIGLLVAGGAVAGCGGGRIGEVASERAQSQAIPNTTPAPGTTSAATPTTSDPGTATASDIAAADARLTADVRDAGLAIAAISAAVAAAGDPSDVPALISQVTTQLQAFDTAVASMSVYRVGERALEALRARLVAIAPRTSDAIRAFTESAAQAADTNDLQGLATAKEALAEALASFLAQVPAEGAGS